LGVASKQKQTVFLNPKKTPNLDLPRARRRDFQKLARKINVRLGGVALCQKRLDSGFKHMLVQTTRRPREVFLLSEIILAR
jgi:hypothetical protein